MTRSPHGQFGPGERFIFAFDIFLASKMEVFVEKCIHHRPTQGVVVVLKIKVFAFHFLFRPIQAIKLLEFGQTFGLQFHGPVVGSRESEWPRGGKGREIDIAGADSQIAGVFARTPSLHRRGGHHGGKCGCDTIIDRREHEGLRTAARSSRDPDPRGIDLRQTANPVHCPQ